MRPRYFSSPGGAAATAPGARKRRAMPESEVAAAVIKSSPVPLSIAEAQESLAMLVKLCPFFLRRLNVSGEEWLEIPVAAESEGDTSAETSSLGSPRKGSSGVGIPGSVPSSPSKSRTKSESAIEAHTRSPRQVKPQGGGLREVRERIRREIESMD